MANPSVAEYKKAAAEAEIKYKLPTGVLSGLIEQESSWNPNPPNAGAGALGLTQIVPKSHPSVDAKRLTKDPFYSIDEGARILAERYKARKGDIQLALTDYHSGQGNTDKFIKNGGDGLGAKGREYAPLVLARSNKYGNNLASSDFDNMLLRFNPATGADRILKKAGIDGKLTPSDVQYAAAKASGVDLPQANSGIGSNAFAGLAMPQAEQVASVQNANNLFDGFKLPAIPDFRPTGIAANDAQQALSVTDFGGFESKNAGFENLAKQSIPDFDFSNVRAQVDDVFKTSAKLEIPRSFESYLDSYLSSNYG